MPRHRTELIFTLCFKKSIIYTALLRKGHTQKQSMDDLTLCFIVSTIAALVYKLYQESKHSRCTKIKCCCIDCERDNLNVEEMESQYKREIDQQPTQNILNELPPDLGGTKL